jgi:hypothetical protein
MKKYLQVLPLIFTLFSCVKSFGQLPPEIVYDDSEIGVLLTNQVYQDYYENESFIKLDSIFFDLNESATVSELTLGESYEFTVSITNTLEVGAVVKAIVNPCSCANLDWTKSVINPGTIGFIKIKYTATIIGDSQKRFTAVFYDNQGIKPLAKKDIIVKAAVAAPNLINQY